MPALPAFCDNCGTVFDSGFWLEDFAAAHFSNNKSGPCPACGGWGSTPDGTLQAVGDVIRLIAGPVRTVEQLRQLEKILAEGKRTQASPQQVAQRLEDEAPAWAALAAYILQYLLPKNAGEFWGILGVVLAALQFFPSQKEGFDDKQVASIVEKAVSSALEQTQKAEKLSFRPIEPLPRSVGPAIAPKKSKTGRNDPCPCASGKKYKRCCIDRPVTPAK